MTDRLRLICRSLCIGALLAGPASAQGISKAHQKLIDGRLSSQFNMTALEEEARAGESIRPLRTDYAGALRPIAEAAARKYRIPINLFTRLVTVESNWNPRAVSHKGAIGLAQLMPATARALAVNPRDPRENLDGGARYLRQQYNRFGTWRLALAAYNAGPEAVAKYNGIPPYTETRNYVRKILGP